jgi:hypothetical protein
MAAWLRFWIGWLALLTPPLQSLLITINYNAAYNQWLPKTRLAGLCLLVCLLLWLLLFLSGHRLYSTVVSFVASSYPWKRPLVLQRRSGFQESATSIPISMDTLNTQWWFMTKNHISIEMCSASSFPRNGLYVTIWMLGHWMPSKTCIF